MESFLGELHSISPVLPFIVRALIVITAVVVLWIFISLPAFWLLKSLGVFLENSLVLLAEFRRALLARASSIFASRSIPTERFVTTHAQMFLFADENRQVKKEIERLRGAVEAVPSRIAALEGDIVDARNKFHSAADSIVQLELPPPMTAPGPQDFNLIQTRRNRAIVTLIFALIFTPAFVIFNTGMLNEFLAGFWPGLDYFGIPLSLILAGFATLFEIALGAFLVLFPSRPAQLLWYAGIVLLVFVEASFYARLGQGFNWSLFDAFYPGGAAPAYTKLWFGVLGPVLVICLAGAGHALVSSITELADRQVVRQWKSHVNTRMKQAGVLREKLGAAERSKGLLVSSLTQVQDHFSTTTDVATSGVGLMNVSKQQFLEQINRAVAIRLEETRRLDRGAMLRQFIENIFFAALVVFALVAIAMVYGSLAVHPLRIEGFGLGWVVAAAQAALLFAAGSASTRANSTVPATDNIPIANLPHHNVARALGFTIFSAVLIANGAYLFRAPNVTSVMLFFLLTAADVFLFWCGTRLGMMGAAILALVQSGSYIATAGVVALAALSIGAVHLLCAGLRLVLIILAFPYTLIFPQHAATGQLSVTRGAT